MRSPVVAIGWDAADPDLLDQWMSQGHLPTLQRLRNQGVYARLKNRVHYQNVSAETSLTELIWAAIWTGCLPTKTGFWGIERFQPDTYSLEFDPSTNHCNYQAYPPFYALGDEYEVITFDLPVATLSDQVKGQQVLGWGGHFPFTPSHSIPASLLSHLTEHYGPNPVYLKDSGFWWDQAYMKWVYEATLQSISTRGAICQDFLQKADYDLFLTVFGDPHGCEHLLWHLSQPDHPLFGQVESSVSGDPMLQCFHHLDQALATMLTTIPESAYVILYSAHGMNVNNTDILSMAILPEVLYRFNFKGRVALAPGHPGIPPASIRTDLVGGSWAGHIWQLQPRHALWQRVLRKLFPYRLALRSPADLKRRQIPLNWMPATWYLDLWPQMQAFALPAFSDGHIRINLKGRERQGCVHPADYEDLCQQLTDVLYRLQDARTGQPLVEKVYRTRRSPDEQDPTLPDSDLVVLWYRAVVDVVDSPDVGRIGPIPFYRTGGHHRSDGFLLAQGPNISPGSLPDAQAVDLGPTILQLLGAPIPDYFDGTPLALTPASV